MIQCSMLNIDMKSLWCIHEKSVVQYCTVQYSTLNEHTNQTSLTIIQHSRLLYYHALYLRPFGKFGDYVQ